jgi:hypothetical protein
MMDLMDILRTRQIRLLVDGNQICALVGNDLVAGVGGFGSTVQEALRDLANQIDLNSDELKLWVPRPARQYLENGILKAACPECGAIKEFPELDRVIASVCSEGGASNDVLNESAE